MAQDGTAAGGPGIGAATRGRLLFGGDYNPEQWPEETWSEDVKLMREAGVTLATVGVFSWATLEPEPGRREFGWLDRVMDLLDGAGIGACLATPTASPPPWLGARHPGTLPRTPDGTVVWYGARNQFCPSSPEYREHALAITRAVAERYAGHPALRMWHINNEYGTHCWCDATAAHFRRWLADRYGDVDGLNEAWGTAFWSQRYASLEEVLPPRRAQYMINPTQQLDFRRFTSDALLECFTAERDAVRAVSPPHVPVTTNFMGFFGGVDGWRWAREEDVVSTDLYPEPAIDPERGAVDGAAEGAFMHDLTRGQAGGGPWMLMESATGAVNFRPVNRPKPAGLARLWSLQAVARGADGVAFFQWRQSRQGAEKFHSAMLPHTGPGSRTFREVAGLGADLARLGAVVGERVAADIGLVVDWPTWWAGEQRGLPSERLDHPALVRAWHRALWEAGLAVEGASIEDADLGRFRMLAVPNLYLASDAALDALVGYVRGGGTLVTGFFSGIADEDDRIRPGGMDARLRELLGLALVHEWWPLEDGVTVECSAGAGAGAGVGAGAAGGFTGSVWSEEVETADAAAVAVFTGGELDGLPAVTRAARGAGAAWYVATLPEPRALRGLLARAAAEAGVEPVVAGLPEGVEAVRRGSLLFLFNHGAGAAEVRLPEGRYVDVLEGGERGGSVTLGRFGAAVLSDGAGVV